jgi:hypothetical protein
MAYMVRMGNHQSGNVKIYNNTFSTDGAPGHNGAVSSALAINSVVPGTVIEIKGNIFSGFGTDDINVDTGYSSLTIDYNIHNPNGAHILTLDTTAFNTMSQMHAQGLELNSPALPGSYSSGYLKFVTIPNGVSGSGYYQLQPGSPAIDILPNASAPTATFTTDILGVSRAQGSAWDIGAFERTNLNAPKNLRITP